MPLVKRLKSIGSVLVHPLFAILVSLLIGSIAILAVGENPITVYRVMFVGAFGTEFALFATLTRATPIIICGLAAAIAWKSGYRGIGGEGQMILGGFVAAVVALYFPGPPALRIALAVILAIAVGGVYSMLSAFLLDKFKVSLAISTLMMNFIANFVVLYFVSHVFPDPADLRIIQTEQLATYMRLPRILPQHTLHYGLFFALILVALAWFLLNRTNFGYESRMTGFNPAFSRYGGVSSRKIMYAVLALSGVISAFAGVVEVFGVNYRYVNAAFTSASFAWIGLSAALISRFHPVGVLFSSLILAGITTGGSAVARQTAMPIEISSIIQGAVILFISAQILVLWRRSKKTAKSQGPEDETPTPAEDVVTEGGEVS
ncbi:MAG: ABC transporter permease [Oscillospiraceae bacterium]|nr:ABC transporter permease [Oscillospiraceae bacterium]